MKINAEFARQFAQDWIEAWNTRNLEAIMSHYSDNVEFASPFVISSQTNADGMLKGKTELRKYFENALVKNPNLHFDLKHIMLGVKSITLIYWRNGTLLASELMVLNREGLVVEGLSHYPAGEFRV